MSDIISMIVIAQMPSRSYMIIRYMIRAATHHITDSISQCCFQWDLAFHFCKNSSCRHKRQDTIFSIKYRVRILVRRLQDFCRALMADGVHYSCITFHIKLFLFLIRDDRIRLLIKNRCIARSSNFDNSNLIVRYESVQVSIKKIFRKRLLEVMRQTRCNSA